MILLHPFICIRVIIDWRINFTYASFIRVVSIIIIIYVVNYIHKKNVTYPNGGIRDKI